MIEWQLHRYNDFKTKFIFVKKKVGLGEENYFEGNVAVVGMWAGVCEPLCEPTASHTCDVIVLWLYLFSVFTLLVMLFR